MMESLDLQTAREFLARTLKSAGRGVGNVGAAVIAVPLGTFQWFMTAEECVSMINLYEKQSNIRILGEENSRRFAEKWRNYLESNPSLVNYIGGWYHNLKPYTPSRYFTNSTKIL